MIDIVELTNINKFSNFKTLYDYVKLQCNLIKNERRNMYKGQMLKFIEEMHHILRKDLFF